MAQYTPRLIERGFPCHQVGAETQRERGASSALPPLYYLHVWWARRPLTPSRAAILASLDQADTDPEIFVRQLGIERVQAFVNGEPWTLTGDLLKRVVAAPDGTEILPVDALVLRRLEAEQDRRHENRRLISQLKEKDPTLADDPVLQRWQIESKPIPQPFPHVGAQLPVRRVMGDPAWAKERISWENAQRIRTPDDKYGYSRAYAHPVHYKPTNFIVLDPTAGGGSIPFEALRLNCRVIANELNPVASAILYCTLDYPVRFGFGLSENIEVYGRKLHNFLKERLDDVFPPSALTTHSVLRSTETLSENHESISGLGHEQLDGFLYTRQVTCPHCGGEAPLLNTCWLSKEAKDPWGVKIVTDGKARNGTVRFETYRVKKGKGPRGEDPNVATVTRGVGQCVHCRQAITGDEIKAQARGESPCGRWRDRLYCVVAVRLEPKLDKNGLPRRYKSGPRKGEIVTRKVRFFRPPNERDLNALEEAEKRLREKWDEWEAAGLIPTEKFPVGNDMRPIHYGMERFCDFFTPRQLLGHLTLVEGLNRLKPKILQELGPERGRAVVTYLQFAIDKGLDYNSRQTRWVAQRGIVSGTFGRHDFSLKWTFGEMIFTGPHSGAAWGLSQVLDAYRGIAELLKPVHEEYRKTGKLPLTILNRTAAHLPEIADESVDLVCMDPPYYNNVQYAELSDYFYVWQKRTLKDLYPDIFHRRLTDKNEEAVANPARDGSAVKAKDAYEARMKAIFEECRRVLKAGGIFTLMFTHKTQEAWETLTQALIDSGWMITASFPVESEFAASLHQKNLAAAASSIFIACRKRPGIGGDGALWKGLGGEGVQHRIERAVKAALEEFAPLRLNPVDEMVACYGRALHVLSENWPVMDGDDPVSPLTAMLEASRVVAENQVSRITGGRLSVSELDGETAMALTLFGIYGLNELPFDDALTLSRSLNIRLETKTGGYRVQDRAIGINPAAGGARRGRTGVSENSVYHAPLVRRGSKLRLAAPEERHRDRTEAPVTDWDRFHGLILAYRKGDAPVARAFLNKHVTGKERRILDLVRVWAERSQSESDRREAQSLLYDLDRSHA